jgi:hypothetical protein
MEVNGQLHVPAAGKDSWIGASWVGLKADLDVVTKEKSLPPTGNRTPLVQLAASLLTELSWLLRE